ncbi:spore coat protein A [Silvibacterium bohemicum]|uniref:Spore coat protein A n=1 Tax=Silvibacterium bohemicum TaxID=1577686 RepID=A0A841JR02_9BACT|nr:multicopper oxidase [Silvibacterium bohemicum]MBB6142845.1 spore coat protein A [Silvibacterium bohemicum]
MKITRRDFVQHASLMAAAAATRGAYAGQQTGHKMSPPATPAEPVLDTNALARYVDPLPIPKLIKASGLRPDPNNAAKQIPYYRVSMRQFQAKVHRDVSPTTCWGYEGSCPGPTFETRLGEPVLVEWVNDLPQKHFLPIDHTLHGAEADKPEVRTVVHLHGGRTGPASDGYPEEWFVPGYSATCYYPNQQEATSLFYHDHAMGITRLNAVAGLTGMYLIRDEFEDSLHLPMGAYEIPLVIFDRSFHTNGQLYYPVSGKPNSPWVSEYYGSAILVNGTIFPYLEVEPRKYRFRLLNSSNGSFYKLSLSGDGSVRSDTIEFFQIGSEQGFLEAPASMHTLILGPGDRADIIVDFSDRAGKEVFLRSDMAVFMQFRVSAGKVVDDSSLPATLRPVPRMLESAASKTRELTIADLQNRLGQSSVMLLNGAHWDMPVTEKPVLNSTEIWSFINLTDDSHPIHLHMVRFQILDRRPFDLTVYQLTKKIVFTGPPVELTATEMGWKDIVRVDPMTVTRIIVKFEGFTGRYVWHCHMLEHEDNEMMRPYEVVPA